MTTITFKEFHIKHKHHFSIRKSCRLFFFFKEKSRENHGKRPKHWSIIYIFVLYKRHLWCYCFLKSYSVATGGMFWSRVKVIAVDRKFINIQMQVKQVNFKTTENNTVSVSKPFRFSSCNLYLLRIHEYQNIPINSSVQTRTFLFINETNIF